MNNQDIEEFEGEESLNPAQEESELDYPKNFKVEKAQYSVFELHRKFGKNLIIMDPEEFQRKDVWNDKQRAELVESILMGIPLPLLYFTEDENGRVIVVDGKQRLTALFMFLDNKLELSKLRILSELNNKKFKNLDQKLQADLEDYQLIAYIIKYPTHDRVKFDIFDRVNRGGTILNNQEMRNAIYSGKSTKLLKKLSESESFIKATNNSIKKDRMKDRYLILRFLAFYISKNLKLKDSYGNEIFYKGDMNDFLGKIMETINKMPDDDIIKLEEIFINTMINSYNILSSDCFRLPAQNRKNPINMGLFESLSYLLSDSEVTKKVEILKQKYNILINNKEFRDSLINIDNSSNVHKRFEIIDKLKEEILNGE